MPKMPSKKVDTITNNEDAVRLEIYEGRLPLDQAQEELHRIKVAQMQAEIDRLKSWSAKRIEWPDLDTMADDLVAQAAPKPKLCPHCGKDITRE